MSQQRPQKPYKKFETPFERMQRQQKYHESRRRYEQQAQMFATVLLGAWSILWLVMGFIIPAAGMWLFLLWAVGCAGYAGGMAKIQMTKQASEKMLSVSRPLEELYRMNPLDFEHAVAVKMRQAGFTDVRVTPSMGDGGIDVLALWQGRKVAVQCKKYRPESFIAIDQLRAFIFAYRRVGAEKGIYVTTAQYGQVARREMAQEGVVLVDGATLVDDQKFALAMQAL